MTMQHAMGKICGRMFGYSVFEQTFFQCIYYHPHASFMSAYPTRLTTPPPAGLLCLRSGNVHLLSCLGSQGGLQAYIRKHELSLKLAEQDGMVHEIVVQVVAAPCPGNQLEAIYV